MQPYFAAIHELDVRDEQAVNALLGELLPVQIYHLAAQSSPHLSFNKPWMTLETNIRGTLNIFEAVHQLGLTERAYSIPPRLSFMGWCNLKICR